jgi:hypothetical protein
LQNVLDEAEKEKNDAEEKARKLEETGTGEIEDNNKTRVSSAKSIEKPDSVAKRSIRSAGSSRVSSANKSGRSSATESGVFLTALEEKKQESLLAEADEANVNLYNETPLSTKLERSMSNFTPMTGASNRTNNKANQSSTKQDSKKPLASTVQFDDTSRIIDNNQG